MRTPWFPTGSVMLAVAVAAGAAGAHALRTRLDPWSLDLWETAVRYLVIGGLGLLAAGLGGERGSARAWWAAGGMLAAGTLIFSGTVGAIALGAPRWLGAVTPIGGVLLIVGFLAMAWAALRR
jgi:uncharacterized membrane protein YgdD (TMEM256/DUF423 family)